MRASRRHLGRAAGQGIAQCAFKGLKDCILMAAELEGGREGLLGYLRTVARNDPGFPLPFLSKKSPASLVCFEDRCCHASARLSSGFAPPKRAVGCLGRVSTQVPIISAFITLSHSALRHGNGNLCPWHGHFFPCAVSHEGLFTGQSHMEELEKAWENRIAGARFRIDLSAAATFP
jgi:hypothetical protein